MRIEVAPPATAAKTITQRFVYCPNGEDWAKREVLRELIRNETVRNAIIFCNRKVEVAILHRSLVKHGFSAGALHGDMDQKNRTETLDKFRAGELMLLAASDVAARGLDIPDVSHIFNFDLPWQSDDYVHRIGRTGRAGKEGNSTSLVTPDELKSLKDIEKMLGEPVVWIGAAPTEEDYAQAGKRKRRGGRGAPRGRGAAPAARAESKSQHGGGHGERRRKPRSQERPEGAEGRPERAPVRAQETQRHDQPRQEQPRQEQPRHEQRRPEQSRPRAAPPRQGAAPSRRQRGQRPAGGKAAARTWQ